MFGSAAGVGSEELDKTPGPFASGLSCQMALKARQRGRNRTEGLAGTYTTQTHNRRDMGSPTDGEGNVAIEFIFFRAEPPFGGPLFGLPKRQLIT
jgi:hypothetical protein